MSFYFGPRTYIIGTVGRTGSSLLCDWLKSLKVLGTPHEYYTEGFPKRYAKEFHLPESCSAHSMEYFQWIISRGHGDLNGIKMDYWTWWNLPFHVQKILVQTCRCFIWLRRRDVIRQAVSLHVAAKTGSWVHLKGPGTFFPPLTLSLEDITTKFKIVHIQDFFLGRIYHSGFICPNVLMIYYEDMIQDPEGTVLKIAHQLGLELPVGFKVESDIIKTEYPPEVEEWIPKIRQHLIQQNLWSPSYDELPNGSSSPEPVEAERTT